MERFMSKMSVCYRLPCTTGSRSFLHASGNTERAGRLKPPTMVGTHRPTFWVPTLSPTCDVMLVHGLYLPMWMSPLGHTILPLRCYAKMLKQTSSDFINNNNALQ